MKQTKSWIWIHQGHHPGQNQDLKPQNLYEDPSPFDRAVICHGKKVVNINNSFTSFSLCASVSCRGWGEEAEIWIFLPEEHKFLSGFPNWSLWAILYAENSLEPGELSQAGLTEIGEQPLLKPYFDVVTCKYTITKTSMCVDWRNTKIF